MNPEHEQENDEELQTSYYLYNYQVQYMRDDESTITRILEATHVETDDEYVEIWNGNVLLWMLRRCAVTEIRNISEIDLES